MSNFGTPPPPPPYGYQGQPGAGAPGPAPANYLVWAILSTLCCCLPLGIASIVFSTQVNSKWAAGDVVGAQQASVKAKQFALWGTIAGVVMVVLYIVVAIIIAATGGGSFSYNLGG